MGFRFLSMVVAVFLEYVAFDPDFFLTEFTDCTDGTLLALRWGFTQRGKGDKGAKDFARAKMGV